MRNKIWYTIHPRKIGYDFNVRTSVRTTVRTFRRVGVSRNEFLPSPLESFVPIVSKAFRSYWQIRICQLTKCLVDFRGRPFDFWGFMGDFRKNVLQTDFGRKKSVQINSWEKTSCTEKKYRSWRIMPKKDLTHTVISREKNFQLQRGLGWTSQTESVKSPIPDSPTNVQWSCQPFRGWRKKQPEIRLYFRFALYENR